MRNSVLRDVVIIGAIGVGAALFFANKDAVYNTIGLFQPKNIDMSEMHPQETQVQTPRAQINQGSVVSIPKSRRDGQFWADARVNSGHVRFLVDTGASSVALTLTDAQKAGIRTRELVYNVPISTAGGQNMAAYVDLKSISVGAITLRNVRALVVPEGLNTSLLGMSYLGQLQKVEATPNALLLRL